VTSKQINSLKKELQMFTNRLFYLLIALFVVTACTPASEVPEVVATLISPTAASLPRVMPTTALPAATATPITELSGKFEVNGHLLFIKCLGTGSPTIVLEAGEGGTVQGFGSIQNKLAKRTTTCAYDRANNGRSERGVPTPRTAKDVVDDLYILLETAEVPGPYLLVGHSAGGMLVQLYARTYPDQVVGVVAMNPVPPAHPWLDQVSRVFTAEEYAGEEAYYQGDNGESLDYLTSSEQLVAAPAPPDVSFEMLLSTSVQCEDAEICLKSYSIYERIMQEVTAAWPHGNFSQVAALHNIFEDDPDAVVTTLERIQALR
jgi:pimeloyl-ACP methyl ester carboxylesterase